MKENYTLRASAAKNHTLNKASRRLKLGEGDLQCHEGKSLDFRENEAELRRGRSFQGHRMCWHRQARTPVYYCPMDSPLPRKADWKGALENRGGAHVMESTPRTEPSHLKKSYWYGILKGSWVQCSKFSLSSASHMTMQKGTSAQKGRLFIFSRSNRANLREPRLP